MGEITSLFYPESKISLGDYTLQKGVNLEVHSAADTYYDWAKFRLQSALCNTIEIKKMDTAKVQLGYDGSLQSVFQGYVYKESGSATAERELLLKDGMLKLEQTRITETFLDASPDEIVRYCLSKAGIKEYKIFAGDYKKRKIVPIVQKSIIQVFEDIKKLWGITDKFYFAKGIFYFGQSHVQDKVYTFEYGNNIIALTREQGLWVLETASVPFIRHSDVINLIHPKVSGEYTVSKVVFTSQSGFIRTRIYF